MCHMPQSAAANPPGKSTRPVAASIKHEDRPRRSTNRPAKFHLRQLSLYTSVEVLVVMIAYDLANILHFHQIIDIQCDPERLLLS